MSRVLVTGASGFVGHALVRQLAAAGRQVVALSRDPTKLPELEGVEFRRVGNFENGVDWQPLLEGVSEVVHLAARVHVMQESSANPLEAFRRANTLPTIELAQACADAGVRRLVFVSTIKVLGESTRERPFRADDPVTTDDPYGISKAEAEQALKKIAQETALQVVILRPTLIYGAGVAGNVRRAIGLIRRGIPLPLASIRNRRSMLALKNLLDVVDLCIDNPAAAGQTLLVADAEPISTPDLFRSLAEHLGQSARLFPCPVPMLRMAGRVTGKSAEVSRLCDSLEVDISETRRILGWEPQIGTHDGLSVAASAGDIAT